MCGIAGLMTKNGAPADAALVRRMGEVLAHRGPDGVGDYQSRDLAMAHRRLAVIDLETGDQPLTEPEGAALVANGEIYNYVELRAELDGAPFATVSDCEPSLFLYRRHGAGYAAHLRGMYAIALHDAKKNQLVLARDPFGIKPLYYAEGAWGIAFASEPKALLEPGLVGARLRGRARNELLQLQFTTGPETIFEGINRVLPGETLIISAGRVIDRRRLAALPPGGPQDWDEAEALARLDIALADSVAVHQRADVPYGMFLSGGIDSSVLLALMARLNDRPVKAFTAGFAGAVHDERDHARALAAKVGAEHVEVDVDERDFWTLLPEIAAAMDDPAADYAVLPTFKLAAIAGRELKVVLTGEGGDELFAGYGRYRSVQRPWWLGGRAMRPKGIFDGLGVLRHDITDWRDGIVAAESMAATPSRTRLQIAQATDCADWLAHDLLLKLDRCLMAHGVEGRTPFLDPAVAEVAFRLPDRLKIRNGLGKYLLRRWLADHLPEARPFSRKRGFSVPVAAWISGRGAELGALVAKQPGIEEICRPGSVESLFRARGKRAGFAAWTLLYFALWHRRHMLGGATAGDVFETLAAAP